MRQGRVRLILLISALFLFFFFDAFFSLIFVGRQGTPASRGCAMGQRNVRGNWRQCQDPDNVGHGKGFFCWPCRGGGRNSQKSARYQIECMKWLYSRVLRNFNVEIQTTLGMTKYFFLLTLRRKQYEFSKASLLPNLPYEIALEPSFKKFQRQEILKSQPTTTLTI